MNLGGGQLEADGIVAGAMTVKVVDEKKATIGSNYIEPKDDNNDGKSYLVKTEAVTESCVILTNFQANPNAYNWVEKVKDESGEFIGFKVMLSGETTQRIYFDWWIVEKGDKTNAESADTSAGISAGTEVSTDVSSNVSNNASNDTFITAPATETQAP